MIRSTRKLTCTILALVFLGFRALAVSPSIIRVEQDSPSNGPGNDWDHAYHTIASGLAAATSGDEVWVAAGVYCERIVLKAGVGLYGGFSGVETQRSERDCKANIAVIDAGGAISGNYAVTGANQSVVDGFVIRNFWTGIYCMNTSPTITNNRIEGAGSYGIYCYNAGTLLIAGNTIARSKSHGIFHSYSSATVSGNQILDNGGTGVNVLYSSPKILNNIISLSHNSFYSNSTDYGSGIEAGPGDISEDPEFLAPWVDDYHLLPTSPCIAAGDNSVVDPTWTDLDSKGRILPTSGLVDIGCFEWDATPYWVRQVGQARAVPGGFAIELRSKPVTATFEGALYVEEQDRSSGCRVIAATAVNQGDVVHLIAQMGLNDGERLLQASTLSIVGHNESLVPKPTFLIGRSLGGGDYHWYGGPLSHGQQGITGVSGLNNIGLLVRVYGLVSDVHTTEAWFRIDDGSGRMIKCIAEEGSPVISASWQGHHAIVTGISSCEFDGPNLVSKIRLKKNVDPVVY